MAKYLSWMVPLLMFVSLPVYGGGEKLVGTWEIDWEANQKIMDVQMTASGMSRTMELRADGTGMTQTTMQGQRTEETFTWRVLEEEGGVFTFERVRQTQGTAAQGEAIEGQTMGASATQITLVTDDVLHFGSPPVVWKREGSNDTPQGSNDTSLNCYTYLGKTICERL